MNDKSVSSFLTGRRRYRIWDLNEAGPVEEVLILQVEKSVWRDHKWVCEWVDAGFQDVTEGELT